MDSKKTFGSRFHEGFEWPIAFKPPIAEIIVTSDGFMLARTDDEVGSIAAENMYGSVPSLLPSSVSL